MSERSGLLLRCILTAITVFVIAALQTTVLRGIEIFHTIPNLLFIFVICYSLLSADYSALAFAAICGLILDLTGGRLIGMNTLLCTLAAAFCLAVNDNLFNNNLFVAMVFVLLLSLPYEFLTYVLYFTIWGRGAIGFALLCKILPTAFYNFVFTVVLYPLTKRLARLGSQTV